ncbi:Histone transcription regulator 3 [Coemansia sp. RSA 1933]|nr:Histone transcription regulator 3 [Coemansia sp. RSA 1933]
MDCASSNIAECQKLMEESLRRDVDISIARCSFSGAPVTLSLIVQRREHIFLFSELLKAEKLASIGDRHATALLKSIIKPFSDTANAEKDEEAALAMYELFLYTSQLLEHNLDVPPAPLKQIIEHCVDCLQRIRELSDTNNSVQRRFGISSNISTMQRLVTQMVSLALAFLSHFLIDPSVDYPASLTEVRFIGLSLWLVAALTSTQNRVYESSAARDMSMYDAAEISGISDDDAKVPSGDSSTGDNEAPDPRIHFMSALHSLLGERGLCTAADGALLLQMLSTCQERLRLDQGNDIYWDVVAACLRCLFDIKLHGSNCDAHRCAHIEMDKDAANLVFTLVESELLSTLRSRKGAGLRSDLKAIVDKTSDVLGDIDMTKYPRLSMNIDAIDDYLDGPSMPLFTHIEQALCADDATIVSTACLPVKKSISNVLSAHLTLPLVRAVTQHDHLLSRMRSGLSRAVEEYDNIIEDYKLNVALNPDSSEAWYQLGQAHSDLADELLLGTASEILSSRFDIAILQRSAISCAVQAKQLLPSLHGSSGSSSVDDGDNCLYEDTQQLRVRVYSFTSCLLYRIASKPLPLLALQILPSNVLVSDDNIDDEHQEWDIGIWKPSEQESPASCRKDGAAVASVAKSLTSRFTRAPPRHRVYSLARRLLVITSKLDADSWKCVYMLGKAMAKLHEPLSACACYLKAVYLAIASDGKHTSTAAGSAPCLAYADDSGSDVPVPATNHPIPMSSVPESAMSPTYKLLSSLAKLLHSSSLDVDTVARFLGSLPFSATNLPNAEHTVFSNSDQAKQTLQTVLQTRSSNRLLSSFYKPDFEAPGKHYLYLEKYLGLYVETLVATSDIEGVQILLRKLKRCSGMFFDPSAMQLRVKTAEISTLNNMVRDLDCPRFVVDNLGKEHIVLQNALDGDSVAREYSVTRHCRLNRTQFNCARDFARDNISFYISFREHLNSAVSAIEKGRAETKKDDATEEDTAAILDPSNSSTDGPLGVVKGAQEAVNRYLCTATKAMALFDLLLEKKKKHFDDADTLSKLNDNLADIYILLLLTYGQERLSIVFHPHQSDDLGELADMCSRITAVISSHKDPKTTSGLFWQRVLFDEASNESSQQYKLLDPLLEFNVNKLLDSVRDARSLQPNPFVRSNPRSAQALAQPAPQPATTAASAGDQLPLAS